MGYMGKERIFRVFDPLHIPKINKTDCVLHISSFLQESKEKSDRREGDSPRDFNCIKSLIGEISNQRISNREGFRLDAVISINGHVENQEYIDYLKSINGTVIGNNVHITIFQRPNVGWQWGGFHDVWMRYKDIDCNWYATIESDNYLTQDNWLDIAIEMSEGDEYGFFGKHQKDFPIDPYNFSSIAIPSNVWRTGDNKTKNNMVKEDTLHSSGGFFFCKKSFLQKMDEVYGCFTHSMGCNWLFDGIVLGEVIFSHKTRELGYKYSSEKFPYYAKAWRGEDYI